MTVTSKRIHGDTEPAFDSTMAACGSGPGSSTRLSTANPHVPQAVDSSTVRRPISLTANGVDASNMAVAESNHIGGVAVKATAHALAGRKSIRASRGVTNPAEGSRAMTNPTAAPVQAARKIAEAEAVGAVLFRAHEAARHLENLLELEAPDPRVGALMQDAKRIRKSIAVLLVDVALESTPEPVMEA